MKAHLTVVLAIVTTSSAFAQNPASFHIQRAHFRVTTGARHSYEWSELIYKGDVDGVVTLWKGSSGEQLIFRQSDVYSRSLMSLSVSDPHRRIFVGGSLKLPYSGSTTENAKRQARKLTAEAYDNAPFAVRVGSYLATAPFADWRTPAKADARAELRRHLSEADFQMVLTNVLTASSFGSPAARVSCDLLLDLIADGTVCRRERAIKPEVLPADCAFDAQFGYPCKAE